MFTRKYTHLEVLDLAVPLGRFQSYHDDGFVDDLVEFDKELRKKGKPVYISDIMKQKRFRRFRVELIFPVPEEDILKDASGYSRPIETGTFLRIKEIHIAYLDQEDDFNNIAIRAHEETHALQFLRKMGFLENILWDEWMASARGLGIEDAADVGAVYGLLRNGYNFDDILDRNYPRLEEAVRRFGVKK